MKLITVIGARPQFIKAAVVSKQLKNEVGMEEIIVHTGQHYDSKMSDIFFEELNIPTPKYNLGVGSASHGKQTARMLEGIEEIIQNENPDALMVYGDTNSTIAGALAASKLHISVAHVEAGLRSFNKQMPEEQNRILTDHISDILFCPTETAVHNLRNEGIHKGIYNTGDVMYDSVLSCMKIADIHYSFEKTINSFECYPDLESACHNSLGSLTPKHYYLATIHRAENTDNKMKVFTILDSFEGLDEPVLFLVHPRTIKVISESLADRKYRNIIFAKPVSYLEMLTLSVNANKILTDSGGLQKEAYFLNVPCITLRDQTEWIETLDGNWNVLSPIEKNTIIKNVLEVDPTSDVLSKNHFGDGASAEKIVDILKRELVRG